MAVTWQGGCAIARRRTATGLMLSALLAAAALPATHAAVSASHARSAVRAQVAADLRAEAVSGFQERDANHDGVLTHAEVPWLRAATFQRVDASGDGRVTLEEALPADGEVAIAASRAEAQMHAAFSHIDANGDDRLDRRELAAFAGPMGADVTPIDFQGFANSLKKLNTAAAPVDATRPPVLMLPGFLMPGLSFGMMKYALTTAGYGRFKVLDRWPWFSDINEFAAEGKFYADQLRKREGAGRLEVVGHSMGGLVGRVIIHQLGYEPYVDHYVSLGTPHHGTILGTLPSLYAMSAVQMTPNSPFLKALNAHEGKASPIRFTSVHAGLDEIVLPHSSADLRGATNFEIPGVFHIPMPMVPEVCTATVAALKR